MIPGGSAGSALNSCAPESMLLPTLFRSRDLSHQGARSGLGGDVMFSAVRPPAGDAKQVGPVSNPESVVLSVRHPLDGLSDRGAGLAVEAQRQLEGGNHPRSGGGLLRVEKTDKKGKRTLEKDQKKSGVLTAISLTTSGGGLAEAIVAIRQNGWETFMGFNGQVVSRQQKSSCWRPQAAKTHKVGNCEEEKNGFREDAGTTLGELEKGLCEEASRERGREARLQKKVGARVANVAGQEKREEDKVALQLQRVTLDVFLAEQQKVSEALAR